jgi:plasmid stability protein
MRTLAAAIDLVLPFASADPTRLAMHKPARHATHIVATDGHTLACARFDGQEHDLVRTIPGSEGPPYVQVLPAALRLLGLWDPARTPQLAHYPAKWSVCVRLEGERATVEAKLPARTGRHGKVLRDAIPMIARQALAGFEEVRTTSAIGVDAAYLLRAAEFMGHGEIAIYGAGALDPLVFAHDSTLHTRADLLAANRFAIVMPMRI